jgi:hypothetical protein
LTLLFRKTKGQTKGLYPWGITSPPGDKVNPWGPNFTPKGEVKTALCGGRLIEQNWKCSTDLPMDLFCDEFLLKIFLFKFIIRTQFVFTKRAVR